MPVDVFLFHISIPKILPPFNTDIAFLLLYVCQILLLRVFLLCCFHQQVFVLDSCKSYCDPPIRIYEYSVCCTFVSRPQIAYSFTSSRIIYSMSSISCATTIWSSANETVYNVVIQKYTHILTLFSKSLGLVPSIY